MPRKTLARLALIAATIGPAMTSGCADRDKGGGSGPGAARSEAAKPAETPSGYEGKSAGQTAAEAR